MLVLLPNLLGGSSFDERYFPAGLAKEVALLDGLIAESVPAGRAFLKAFSTKKPAHLLPIAHLHKDIKPAEVDFFLDPLLKGQRFGLISDAGLPCLADPGHLLVKRARERGIEVKMVMGPSSLLMGLMLSGLPGQVFSFHGYLPKKPQDLIDAVRTMPKNTSHLFIEAPFRNNKVMKALLAALPSHALLSLAIDLTLPTEKVITKEVSHWKKTPWEDLDGRYCLFLFYNAK